MSKILFVEPLQNPRFLHPVRLRYEQDGTTKEWEAIEVHDSVAILLYHTTRKAFILVKQLRPAVLHATKDDGMMYELCAGIIDKDLPKIQIAQEEVIEECGYHIPLDTIQEITTFYTSVGFSGTQQTLYFAKIDDSMQISKGGGLAEESIEVITLPIEQAKEFIFDSRYKKTPGLMMAIYWFFDTQHI